MIEVESIYGTPIFVSVMPDADFDTYGYYYEIFADENCERLLDWGNTYDHDYTLALEYACGLAETLEYAAL